MWFYRSPVGLMNIRYVDSKYRLYINDICYSVYTSPILVADSVVTFTTGCYEWDSLDGEYYDYPSDLSDWEHH